jgi:hypothetical protein
MNELNEFFKLVAEEKKKKKEQLEIMESKLIRSDLDEIVSSLGNPFSSVKPKKKKKKVVVEVKEEIKEEVSLVEKSLGLLAEPSDIKQQKDPLTPLDQKFATLDDLQKHYKLFLERIQQQLSTLGGGGETNLTYMDVPLTSVTSSSYTVKLQDYYIGVYYAGAVTITLPHADREGKIFVIKDELGEASKGTNRYITVLPSGTDKIDGRSRAILAYDYGSLTFIWKGNSWRVI